MSAAIHHETLGSVIESVDDEMVTHMYQRIAYKLSWTKIKLKVFYEILKKIIIEVIHDINDLTLSMWLLKIRYNITIRSIIIQLARKQMLTSVSFSEYWCFQQQHWIHWCHGSHGWLEVKGCQYIPCWVEYHASTWSRKEKSTTLIFGQQHNICSAISVFQRLFTLIWN